MGERGGAGVDNNNVLKTVLRTPHDYESPPCLIGIEEEKENEWGYCLTWTLVSNCRLSWNEHRTIAEV